MTNYTSQMKIKPSRLNASPETPRPAPSMTTIIKLKFLHDKLRKDLSLSSTMPIGINLLPNGETVITLPNNVAGNSVEEKSTFGLKVAETLKERLGSVRPIIFSYDNTLQINLLPPHVKLPTVTQPSSLRQ